MAGYKTHPLIPAVRQLIARHGPRIAILGPPGSGKTALLQSIVRHLNRHGLGDLRCFCLYLDLRRLVVGTDSSMYEQLTEMLRTEGRRLVGANGFTGPFSEDLRKIAGATSENLIIAVDHVDDVPWSLAIDLVQQLRGLKEMSEGNFVSARVGLLISGAVSLFKLRRHTQSGLAQTEPFTLPIQAAPLRRKMVEVLVNSTISFSTDAIAYLTEETGGEPAFLDPLLGRLSAIQEFDGQIQSLEKLLNGTTFEKAPYLRRILMSVLLDPELTAISKALIAGGHPFVKLLSPDIDLYQLTGAVISDGQVYKFRNRLVARFVRDLQSAIGGNDSSDDPLIRELLELKSVPDRIKASEDLWSAVPHLLRAWEISTPYAARPRLHLSVSYGPQKPMWLELPDYGGDSDEPSRPEATENARNRATISGKAALAYDGSYVAFATSSIWRDFQVALVATGARSETQYTENGLTHWECICQQALPYLVRHALILLGKKSLQTQSSPAIPEKTAEEQDVAKYDIFLSFSSANRKEAGEIKDAAEALGIKLFLSTTDLETGSPFSDQIRKAILGSRQVWVLASPDALKSTWIHTEWGAAWILSKPILPILFRLSSEALPDRLNILHAIDYHSYRKQLEAMAPSNNV